MDIIRRNPGTSWMIFCVMFTFVLGLTMGIFGWNELAWRCWVIIAMWYMVTFHARWIDNRMENYFAKRDANRQNPPI